jgi:hypothetical protein
MEKKDLGTLKKQVITIARENKPNCYNLFFERSLLKEIVVLMKQLVEFARLKL